MKISHRLSQSKHFDTWLALTVVDYDYVYLKNLKNQLIRKIDQKQLNFTMMRNVCFWTSKIVMKIIQNIYIYFEKKVKTLTYR